MVDCKIRRSRLQNLDLANYVTENEFSTEMGQEMLTRFYHKPNPSEEITPQFGEGYKFKDLLTEDDVKRIPDLPSLYPGSVCDIAKDIATLVDVLPKVGDYGIVSLKSDPELKKRKLEDLA